MATLADLNARYDAGDITATESAFIVRLRRSKWWRDLISIPERLTSTPEDIEWRNRIDEGALVKEGDFPLAYPAPRIGERGRRTPLAVSEYAFMQPEHDGDGKDVRSRDELMLEWLSSEGGERKRCKAYEFLPPVKKFKAHPLVVGYRMPWRWCVARIDVPLIPAYYRNISAHGEPREGDLAPIVDWLKRGGWSIEEARSVAARNGRPPKGDRMRHWLGVRFAELSIMGASWTDIQRVVGGTQSKIKRAAEDAFMWESENEFPTFSRHLLRLDEPVPRTTVSRQAPRPAPPLIDTEICTVDGTVIVRSFWTKDWRNWYEGWVPGAFHWSSVGLALAVARSKRKREDLALPVYERPEYRWPFRAPAK